MTIDHQQLHDLVRDAWTAGLGAPPRTPEADYFKSGGDSLITVRMVSRLRRQGVDISPVHVLRGRTFAGLLAQLRSAAVSEVDVSPPATGPVPLLPTQARWVSNRFTEPDHFNLGWVFQLPDDHPLTTSAIEEALRSLTSRHEALRTKYVVDSSGSATADVVAAGPVDLLTEVTVADDEVAGVLRAGQLRHDLAAGRVITGTWLPKQRLLQVTLHHITLDGYSVGVVADDLETAMLGKDFGAAPGQPRAQTRAIERWLAGQGAQSDAARWRDLGWADVHPVPVDDRGPGELPSMTIVSDELNAEATTAVQNLAERRGIGLDLLVAAAAARAIAERFGQQAVSIDTYHHGRNPLPGGPDLSAAVGYFQSSFPVVLGRGTEPTWLDDAVADLARVPADRFGFDALRFHGHDDLNELPSSGVRLNFRGRMNEIYARENDWLKPAEVDAPGRRARQQTEPYVLMLEGDVAADRLAFSIKHSRDHFEPAVIDALVARTLGLLTREATR